MSTPSQPRGPSDPPSPPGLVEHYFRHEYGRLVAVLVRRVGLHHLEAVEDAVQGALLAALTAWVADGVPDNSGAWLYRVAHNHVLGVLRKDQGHRQILDGVADRDLDNDESPVSPAFAGEVRDELLRMLFVCCDEKIPPESRLVLALKTLCGFSIGEIAFRLFTTEANVYKRLARARDRLREGEVDTQTPPLARIIHGRPDPVEHRSTGCWRSTSRRCQPCGLRSTGGEERKAPAAHRETQEAARTAAQRSRSAGMVGSANGQPSSVAEDVGYPH